MTMELLTSIADGPAQPGMVSVVIIFLNEACFLREAIESVRGQNQADWELLLVDDGSTDGSAAIAEAFASGDQRIRYLTHPGRANRGMSASRNLGLSHARGEYVAFLDGDDVYLPDRLSRHVEILTAHPGIAMVVSDHLRWFADHEAALGSRGAVYTRSFFALGDQIWKPPMGLMVTMGVSYLGLGICNVTVRRSVALAVGGFEDQFTSMFEDQAFTSKVLARHPVYVLQAYLARYRHHSGSWTRRAKESGAVDAKIPHADTIRFVNWLLGDLQGAGIADPLLLDLIRARLPRAGSAPGAAREWVIRVTATCKRWLRVVLPDAWQVRLLVMDYELDRRGAQRAYMRLTDRMSKRALQRALQSGGSGL